MNRLISALILSVLATAAGAAPYGHGQREHFRDGPTINQRQHWQDARIERAFQRGLLSFREAQRLDGEQRRIERLEWQFRRDGVFTRYERNIVQRELNFLSAQIERATSNSWGRRG